MEGLPTKADPLMSEFVSSSFLDRSLFLVLNSAAQSSSKPWSEPDLRAYRYGYGGMHGLDVNCPLAICSWSTVVNRGDKGCELCITWESGYRHTWKPSVETSGSVCSLATYLFLTKITSGFHFLVTTRLDKTLSKFKKNK